MRWKNGDAVASDADDLACMSAFLSKAISDLDFDSFSAQEQRGLVAVVDALTERLRGVSSEIGHFIYDGTAAGDVGEPRAGAPDLTEPASDAGKRRRTA